MLLLQFYDALMLSQNGSLQVCWLAGLQWHILSRAMWQGHVGVYTVYFSHKFLIFYVPPFPLTHYSTVDKRWCDSFDILFPAFLHSATCLGSNKDIWCFRPKTINTDQKLQLGGRNDWKLRPQDCIPGMALEKLEGWCQPWTWSVESRIKYLPTKNKKLGLKWRKACHHRTQMVSLDFTCASFGILLTSYISRCGMRLSNSSMYRLTILTAPQE